METTVPKTPRELRNFALVMTGALVVLGGLLVWRDRPAGPYLFGVAALFLLLGLTAPQVLRPVEWAWMKFASALGVVMTYVILTLTFYLLITPVGMLLRVLRKRPLHLRFDPEQSSYWEAVDKDGPAGRSDTPY